ncbi:MAG: DUF6714 family protein [Tepidisphaeraceae bacterium]
MEDERAEIADFFSDRPWTDISLHELRSHPAALTSFSLRAFRYFLPAYMSAIAREFYASDFLAPDLIRSLSPTPAFRDRGVRRKQVLTTAEVDVVRQFLVYLKASYADDLPLGSIEQAIHDYSVHLNG